MMKKLSIAAIAVLLFTACQKVVDANELLDTQERISILSYISPQDTILRVNVTRALPAIGTPLSVQDNESNEAKFLIKNAEVTISNEAGNSTTLNYSEETKSYLADASTLTIVGDETYFLKVNVDGVEYNTSCRVPQKVTEINELVNLRDDGFGGTEAELNISFKDIVGEKNFYVLGGFTINDFENFDGEIQRFTTPLFFDTDEFQTDNLEDGSNISGKASLYVGQNGSDNTEQEVTLQVAIVEEILFQNLRAAATNANSDGNPFVEYAISPNNLEEEGAVGVFAGYNLTEKIITIAL